LKTLDKDACNNL